MQPTPSRKDRRHGPNSDATLRTVSHLLQDAQRARDDGDLQRAWNLCERALALNPFGIDALCAYGLLATRIGRADVAIQAAGRAAKLSPARVEALHCLGAAQRLGGQVEHAIGTLGRALELQPDHVPSLTELALCFIDLGDARAAEPFLRRALEIESESSSLQSALGRLYASTRRLDDAIAACERAMALDPHDAEPCNVMGDALRDGGDVNGAIAAYRRAISIVPYLSGSWSNLLLSLQCSDRHSTHEIVALHREFGEYFAKQLRPLPSVRVMPRGERRLRIGYLSAHFRRHVNTRFFEPLIAAHDRNRVEIFCYDNGVGGDKMTDRIRELSEHFMSIRGMRDGHAAAQIRRDGIDILVDLDGHIANNRLPIFMLRPAPIQVTWLGYLSTTGVAAIDYRLADELADPTGIADPLHVERLWRLPRTAWCYQPLDGGPDPGRPPCGANGHLTFGCFNHPSKITPSILELWAQILNGVDDSRLLLHVSPRTAQHAEVIGSFSSRGVAPDRITLIDWQPIDRYLETYNCIDVALDTWPCAGGATTCDALWMGVPVISLSGERSYSRTGASLLASVRLDDLVAETPQAYVETAIAVARDRERLESLRVGLRSRMQLSPLLNPHAFARDVEAAFAEMWDRRVAAHGTGKE